MNSFRKFCLTGVLAVSMVMAGMTGVADAQTLSCGATSLSIDTPYELRQTNFSSEDGSGNGQAFTITSTSFATPTDKNDVGVVVINLNLVVKNSEAPKVSLENYFNAPDFINDLKDILKSSLGEADVNVADMRFTDVAYKGMPAKTSMCKVSSSGENGELDTLTILKNNAIWIVCVLTSNNDAAIKILGSIE